jgi:hypothetical protein
VLRIAPVLSKNQKIGVALALCVIIPQKKEKEILDEKLTAEKMRVMPNEYHKGTESRLP